MRAQLSESDVDARIRNALWAVAFQIVVTVGFVSLGAVAEISERYAVYADPWNLADAVLLAILGAGVYFRSRTAAIALLVYFVFARAVLMASGASGALTSGLLVAIGLFVFYARAVHACFVHHRLRREEDPAYRPRAAPVFAAGCLVVGLFGCAILGAGLAAVVAPTGFVREGALEPRHVRALRHASILEPGEHVLGGDFASLDYITDEGIVVTETRVVAFQADILGGGIQRQERDRADVVHAWTEQGPLGSVLWIETLDRPPLEVWVADEQSAAQLEALLRASPTD